LIYYKNEEQESTYSITDSELARWEKDDEQGDNGREGEGG